MPCILPWQGFQPTHKSIHSCSSLCGHELHSLHRGRHCSQWWVCVSPHSPHFSWPIEQTGFSSTDKCICPRVQKDTAASAPSHLCSLAVESAWNTQRISWFSKGLWYSPSSGVFKIQTTWLELQTGGVGPLKNQDSGYCRLQNAGVDLSLFFSEQCLKSKYSSSWWH